MFKIFVVICMFLALNTNQAFSQKLNMIQGENLISLDLKDMPLNSVAEEVYKQIGCKIIFDEKWNNLLLSGQYAGVTLEEFFWRSLRKYNVSLSYDDKNNIATLRFFGDRDIGKTNIDSLASRNAASGGTNKETKVMREEQHQQLVAYFNDPESIDPESGMTFGEIKEMRSTQRAEQERWKNDSESIDSVSGMRLGDIKQIYSDQRAEQERWQNDPEAIDPVSGIKLVDIKKMRSGQRAEQERWQNDPEAIDPVSGIKLVDIKKMRSVRRGNR
ncbi:MAG: hypothetical protein PHZ02_03615 [Desulfocapsaceae bacterium]|nr:hypothetical protein [Desulfocapsaceae bacterium]